MTYKLGKDGWPTDETVIATRDKEVESLRQQLAECQAREKIIYKFAEEILYREERVLGNSWYLGTGQTYGSKLRELENHDSTALDTLKKQWQREALLEAADWFDTAVYGIHYLGEPEDELIRMAKELE